MMDGRFLALGAVAAVAAVGLLRPQGNRSLQVKVASCRGPHYHTTTWNLLSAIAREGLQPNKRPRFRYSPFYTRWSQGKVFVAQSFDDALYWFERVSSIEQHEHGEVRYQDDLFDLIPVLLRVDLRGMKVESDYVGQLDDNRPCSYYVTEPIEPSRIWFYDGSAQKWMPISEWATSDPNVAIPYKVWREDPESVSYSWIEYRLATPWEGEPGAFSPRDGDVTEAERDWKVQLAPRSHGSRAAQQARFVVRSPKEGLALINHPDIVKNYRAALRVKPKHKTAVLVPCAAHKPIGQAPSHVHGYGPALQGKDVDVWIVSEPLGVVPYAWHDRYPNDAYDFPPEYLRDRARSLLVERIRGWIEAVGAKYGRLVLALPAHHARLVKEAAKGTDQVLEDASISVCRDEGACGSGVHRATSTEYREFLRGSLSTLGWDDEWWEGPHKFVTISGAEARIYKVGTRLVLVFERDFDGRGRLKDPMLRWTFVVRSGRIEELRMTGVLRKRYLRDAPKPDPRSPTRSGPREVLDKIQERVQSDLQRAYKGGDR